MEREVGAGIGMGNTCKPLAVSFQCMTKSTTKKKKKRRVYLSVQGHSFGTWDFQFSLRMWDLHLWCVNSWLLLVS